MIKVKKILRVTMIVEKRRGDQQIALVRLPILSRTLSSFGLDKRTCWLRVLSKFGHNE